MCMNGWRSVCVYIFNMCMFKTQVLSYGFGSIQNKIFFLIQKTLWKLVRPWPDQTDRLLRPCINTLVKIIEAGLFFTETSDYCSEIRWASYRPSLFTNWTLLCHICWRMCSQTVTHDMFPVIIFEWIVTGATCAAKKILPINDIYITEFVSFRIMFTDSWLWFVCLD